ncbi:MAG: hypothetical protein JF609_07320 [Verrucomicrobia bacterium]|nr:hypothetical protein [Verrucomicrobiota bacterium]
MPGFWRKCRIAFRWTRYCFWLLVILALFALAWVNEVGFPDFVKQRLAAAVRERGVTLEFSRMRWRLIHGIVAENVIIGDRQVHGGKPLLTAGQIQLRLDYEALVRGKFQLSGVVVRDGIFTLPVTATSRFAFLNMQGEVRFLPDDTWSLDELKADFSGVKLRLAGQMAHATDVTKWQLFAGQKPSGGQGALAQPLRDVSDALVKIKFTGQPQISATLNGDARDVHSFTLQVNASAPGIMSPWFDTRELQFAASVTAPTAAPADFDAALAFWTNALPFRATWTARAAGLDLRNFSAHSMECGGEWSAPQLAVTKCSAQFGGGKINLSAALDVKTRELNFTNASAFDPHSVKIFLPESARGWLAEILWTQPPSLAVDGLLTLPAWTNNAADWRGLIGPAARLHGELACTNAVVHGQTLDLVRTHFNYANQIWSAPDLKFTQGRTRLEFSGEESTVTDNIRAALRGYLDAETVRPFLPTNVSTPLFQIVKLAPILSSAQKRTKAWRPMSLMGTGCWSFSTRNRSAPTARR